MTRRSKHVLVNPLTWSVPQRGGSAVQGHARAVLPDENDAAERRAVGVPTYELLLREGRQTEQLTFHSTKYLLRQRLVRMGDTVRHHNERCSRCTLAIYVPGSPTSPGLADSGHSGQLYNGQLAPNEPPHVQGQLGKAVPLSAPLCCAPHSAFPFSPTRPDFLAVGRRDTEHTCWRGTA